MPNLKYIEDSAFGGSGIYDDDDNWIGANYCASLKSIGNMPKLESIGYGAFDGCSALEHVGNLSNVKTIGVNAFLIAVRLNAWIHSAV